MEINYKRQEQIKILLENLISFGISKENATSFIENNLDILFEKDININDYIYFVLNNQDIYGIILADQDVYYWSNYIDGELTNLKTLSNSIEENLEDVDYIINMVINFANSEKIKRIIPTIENYSIENKLRVLKKIGLNKNGYHIK